jgi:hypothetical protein
MQTYLFTIDENAVTRFLVNDMTRGFLTSDSLVKRASHIEPVCHTLRVIFYALRALFGDAGRVSEYTRTWHCLWRINLTPVHGPIIPIDFRSRSLAMEFEVSWLNENFL